MSKMKKVWWFPNTVTYPIQVAVYKDELGYLRLWSDVDGNEPGTEVTFWYDTYSKALAGGLAHAKERKTWFEKRIEALTSVEEHWVDLTVT